MLRRASFLKDSSCLFIDKDYLSYTLLIDSGFFRPTFVTNSLKIHIFLEVLFTPFCYFYYYLFYFILFYFILFYFILFYFILFYFILFYFILFYFILFYFILFYFIHLIIDIYFGVFFVFALCCCFVLSSI